MPASDSTCEHQESLSVYRNVPEPTEQSYSLSSKVKRARHTVLALREGTTQLLEGVNLPLDASSDFRGLRSQQQQHHIPHYPPTFSSSRHIRFEDDSIMPPSPETTRLDAEVERLKQQFGTVSTEKEIEAASHYFGHISTHIRPKQVSTNGRGSKERTPLCNLRKGPGHSCVEERIVTRYSSSLSKSSSVMGQLTLV